ncbi:right-handed parallel beta-helix repeat-containing protein [Chitinophaga nivalis]|uniref:Right-handed parallel beta-helix repeat-containing protein n=1 Tax=Chitinophaga nivalis TaxID=2991709 RepID=A0ABT3ITM4_9BACT|nr:right-handed parallel beta-helix repeat-containing protein [Chitinophaga nivalis]MCW3462987.1 right-handed parallel beta-helix repeat-containing protein [Chitinophaga nivalis]MCW3487323.1 right-handed parallel beta-helix repeat-containing protein [Chitinophaga nivalis]
MRKAILYISALLISACGKQEKNIYLPANTVLKSALVTGPVFDNMAALKASTTVPLPGSNCTLSAYYAADDGGGGAFTWDAGSTLPDDSGVIIQPTSVTGAGRWKRIYSGAVSLKWFGLKTVEQGFTQEQGTRLNSILAKYQQVNFDLNGTINIDALNKFISVPSNSKITFSKDSCKLRVIPNGAPAYWCMRLWNVHDCEINNAHIIGDRVNTGNRTGEFGMGIDIRSSSRITINDATVKDCWGDGIYIGKVGTTTNRDIRIINAVCDHNGRQGISLITGVGITIQNARLLRSDIHSPCGGLDIEPNDVHDTLMAIRVINTYTSGNKGRGINVTPEKMAGTTTAVDIRIEGHISEQDTLGFSALGMSDTALAGNVVYANGKISQASRSGISIRRYSYNMPLISIQDAQVTNCNTAKSTSIKYGAAVCIFREPTETNPPHIGAVEMINLKITDDRPVPLHASAIYVRDEGMPNNAPGPVTIKNPVSLGATVKSPLAFACRGVIQDDNHVIVKNLVNETFTQNWTTTYCRYTNTSSTTRSIVNLAASAAGYPDVEFVVTAAAALRIKPDATSIIQGLTTAGGYLESNQTGATIILRKTTANEWTVVKQTGTWTPG